jgi:hypothetical protein
MHPGMPESAVRFGHSAVRQAMTRIGRIQIGTFEVPSIDKQTFADKPAAAGTDRGGVKTRDWSRWQR